MIQHAATGSFNSRPRTGGIYAGGLKMTYLEVSILAPAQGASKACSICPLDNKVSILAPAQGAWYFQYFAAQLHCFNSRPRTGGIRLLYASILILYRFQFSPPHRGHGLLFAGNFILFPVSILAPAQGASQK